MHRPAAAITLIAGTLLVGAPAFAAARPAPDPLPQHLATTCRDAALTDLIAAYRTATPPDKRRIHSEVTLILHHLPEGWAS